MSATTFFNVSVRSGLGTIVAEFSYNALSGQKKIARGLLRGWEQTGCTSEVTPSPSMTGRFPSVHLVGRNNKPATKFSVSGSSIGAALTHALAHPGKVVVV